MNLLNNHDPTNRSDNLLDSFRAAAQILENAMNIVIVGHMNPDLDAICSTVFLANLLESKGKHPSIFLEPNSTGVDIINDNSRFCQTKFHECHNSHLLVCLDSDDINFLAKEVRLLIKETDIPILVIDHHAQNENYGTHNLVSDQYVSTTEILYDLTRIMNWEFSVKCTDYLLLGIMSDTQLFSRRGVTQETFKTVLELTKKGSNYDYLRNRYFSKVRTGYIKLLGRLLSSAKLEKNIYWANISEIDFVESGLDIDEDVFIVDELIKDSLAQIAVSFRMLRPNIVKIRLRSTSIDIGAFADKHGGGGHREIAGFKLRNVSLEEANELILPELIGLTE